MRERGSVSIDAGFDELIAGLTPVGLDDVDAISTFSRFDHKFLLDDVQLRHLLIGLGSVWSVLEVGGARESSVSSVYFDTDDLLTYRAHVQGRRRRFKIRTRHYGDPSSAWLEVKLKAARGRTVKQRIPHPTADPSRWCPDSLTYVEQVLREGYGFGAPALLSPSVRTAYDRTTLVDVDEGVRVTIDRRLRVGEPAGARTVSLGERASIVEIKAVRQRSEIERVLVGVGARPQRLSKYCMGVVTLQSGVAGNRWRPQLRRLVDDDRSIRSAAARGRVG